VSVRLLVSFSGGETSAFMAYAVKRSRRYSEVRHVFANTGQENEQTLEFVQKCDEAFGLGVEWVEAVMQHSERKAPLARVVDFATASRQGEPFEDAIRKYGIPNKSYPHCSRSLKLDPIRAHMANTGWEAGSYDIALGIRVDEFDRMSATAAENRIVYPLINWWPTTKPEINSWWRKRPFRLELKGYQGNCRWCWKKSVRKHLTLLSESPDDYDFPRRMEAEYGLVGPEFTAERKEHQRVLEPGYRRKFFREGRSVADLEALLVETPDFARADDDAQVFSLFDPMLDAADSCEESCEVFADETQDAA
jgi:hypothetical protein